MTKGRFRHSYYTQGDSPTRLVMDYLKQCSGRSFQTEIDDLLLIHLYPEALREAGATPELVKSQIQVSIHRLRQAMITALEANSSFTALEAVEEPKVMPLQPAPKVKLAPEVKDEDNSCQSMEDLF